LSQDSQPILLTGGTGFFGRALLRSLLDPTEHEQEFLILSRDPQKFLSAYPLFANSPHLRFIQGDIQERSSLPWQAKLSGVLHAATDSTLGPRLRPLKRFQQIVEGTTNILDLAVETGAKRFLLTSSGGIYGQQPPDLFAMPEDWAGAPPLPDAGTAYSQGKRAAEHLCALYRDTYGIETVIARCFAFIGPDLPLDVHFAIGNFIRDALYRESITVAGDGTAVRSYLEQNDLATWLLTLLRLGVSGETYNVGSDHAVTIRELSELVRDLLAPSKAVHILGSGQAASSRSRYVPDISKARRELGLEVHIPLDQAIMQTAAAHKISRIST